MAEDAPADEAPITFNVKSSSDAKYVLTVPLNISVLDLKQKLSTSEYADLPPERQRLIYSGRVLKDPDTLASYKIKEGHTVHLVKGAASNQRQNPANQGSSTTSGASGTSSSTPAGTGVPTNIAAGTGNNPLAGLTGARYAGFAQLPNQNMFGPDGGMGPPPDPEQVISMLQNPQFASTLNEALQNPQLIDMMIQQNPMLRNMGPEVRQMMQSPEFRRMMTDPEALRNMSQMQRMFGGGFGGMGGGGGGGGAAFPAPGVTDTTPGQEGNTNTPTGNTQAPPPFNPMAMFGNPLGAAGQAAPSGNPFGVLFGPLASANNPTTSPPTTAAAGQGTSDTPATSGATESRDASSSISSNPNPNPSPFGAYPNPNSLFQNPALMQQMLAAMGGGGGGAASAPGQQQNPSGGDAGGVNNGFNPFAAMFGPGGMLGGGGGLGGGQGAAAPVQDTRPPEDRYAEQLRQLNDMGFYEFERNVEALRRTGGSVQGAVEYLLTH